MKTLLVFLMLAAVDGEAPFAGKWAVQTSIAGNDVEQACVFTQEGAAIGGTCESARGKVEIKGKVDGKAVSWEYKSEHDGTPLVVAYKGTLGEDGKLKGTVSVDAFGVEGEFTAARPQ
jgi:hypothetical protein